MRACVFLCFSTFRDKGEGESSAILQSLKINTCVIYSVACTMNKTGMRVYNINSQGSFCSSELLLNGSEQSSRQIGQSSPNRADIRLSLIRPHQRRAPSPAPLISAARNGERCCSPRSPAAAGCCSCGLEPQRSSGLSGGAGGIPRQSGPRRACRRD